MIAVITAGGKGTRMKGISGHIPKPMIPLCGRPVLEHQIISLKNSGIDQIIITVGYLGHVIQNYFADGSRWDVKIEYIEEAISLGTGGALYYLKERLKKDFLFIYGDLMLDIDWNRFAAFHQEKDATVTAFVHPNSHPFDSDLILVGGNGKIIGLDSKHNIRDYDYHNLVNAGIYVLSPEIFADIMQAEKLDFEKDIMQQQIENGTAYGYVSTEYAKDMGTPERLKEVEQDYHQGLIKGRCYQNRQRAIFLDRDGTINVQKGFLTKAEDFVLIDGVSEAIRHINQSGYLCIVITNQPVVARGEANFEELDRIHRRMETLLGKDGTYIDGLFFCPHHPDSGFEGEIHELKVDCDCRKPKTGMIKAACKKFNIDTGKSWCIGDRTVDIMTGINAGIKTILVKTGDAGKDRKYDCKADHETDTLIQAITYIQNSDGMLTSYNPEDHR